MKTIVSFILPFHIYEADGEYQTGKTKITLNTVSSESKRDTSRKENLDVVGLYDTHGLYKYTDVSLETEGLLNYQFKSPPPENYDDFYQWYLILPEIYHFVTRALNALINSIKVKQNLFYVPNFSPLMISESKITLRDDNGNERKVMQAMLTPVKLFTKKGVIQKPDVKTTYDAANFHELQLLNSKRAVFENNLRAAILELNNAFEYYVYNDLANRLDEKERKIVVREISVKESFLDEYKDQLPSNVLNEIENLEEKGFRYPSVFKTLEEIHNRLKFGNLPNTKLNKLVSRITKHRNTAAHGREIAYEMHEDVIDGIKAFEEFVAITNEKLVDP